MEKRVKTPKELMNKLELYSVPVKDVKGNIDYFMISSSLYKEIWWGLLKMQKQMDNQEREKVINSGQAEAAEDHDTEQAERSQEQQHQSGEGDEQHAERDAGSGE